MGFLDFLTKPRLEATPQDPMTVTPYEQPQAAPMDGLLSAVPEQMGMGAPEQMQRMPQLEEKPSLLGGFGKQVFGKDDDGIGFWDRIYAAAGTLGGEDGGSYLNQKRQLARGDREKAAAKEDLARKNAAFRAAYGPDGKFNPQAYLDAMGDQGDASEAFSLADKLRPKTGVSGDTPYTIDNEGNVNWGPERPWSRRDQENADKNDELSEYRQILAEIAKGRLSVSEGQAEIARRREARMAAGGGGGAGKGGGPPPPAPGWTVSTVGP